MPEKHAMSPWAIRLVESLVTGGATVLGSIAGPEGAVGGAVAGPLVSQAFIQAAQLVRDRWKRNSELALSEAAHRASLSVDELLELATADPVRQELFVTVLEAAARSTMDAKIRVLGSSLAAGTIAAKASETDHEILFSRAIADFDEPHLHLLDYFADAYQPGMADYVHHRSTATLLRELEGVDEATLPNLMGALERHGTIQQRPVNVEEALKRFGPGWPVKGFTPEWKITPFGRECIERLREAGRQAAG